MVKSWFLEINVPLNESINVLRRLQQFLAKARVIDQEHDIIVNDLNARIFIFLITENDDIVNELKEEFKHFQLKESSMLRYRAAARKRMEQRVLEETAKLLYLKNVTRNPATK